MNEEKLEQVIHLMKMSKMVDGLIYHGNITGQICKTCADILMSNDPEFQHDMFELQEKYKNKYRQLIKEL